VTSNTRVASRSTCKAPIYSNAMHFAPHMSITANVVLHLDICAAPTNCTSGGPTLPIVPLQARSGTSLCGVCRRPDSEALKLSGWGTPESLRLRSRGVTSLKALLGSCSRFGRESRRPPRHVKLRLTNITTSRPCESFLLDFDVAGGDGLKVLADPLHVALGDCSFRSREKSRVALLVSHFFYALVKSN
jgi:hypothetical protein